MKKASQSWIEFAKRDLAAAEKLVEDEYVANVVLYHSQQAVEKTIKSLYEEFNIKIPRIHSVTKLYSDLHLAVPSLPDFADEDNLLLIDDIYIDTRYPGAFGLLPSGFPTKGDAEKIFEHLQRNICVCRKDF